MAPQPLITVTLTDWTWLPDIWSNHINGANYLARIHDDQDAPNGVYRGWMPRSKGRPGHVVRLLAPGDAFECGSTSVKKGGTAIKNKIYGVVREVSKETFTYQEFANAQSAIASSGEVIKALPVELGALPHFQRQIRGINKQIQDLTAARDELMSQVKHITDMAGDGAISDDVTQQMTEAAIESLGMETPEQPTQHSDIPVMPAPKNALPLQKLNHTTPADDDDDEDELSPAQIAALAKFG